MLLEWALFLPIDSGVWAVAESGPTPAGLSNPPQWPALRVGLCLFLSHIAVSKINLSLFLGYWESVSVNSTCDITCFAHSLTRFWAVGIPFSGQSLVLPYPNCQALPGLYIAVRGDCCGHPFHKFPNPTQSPFSSFNAFSARNWSPSWACTSQISWCIHQSHVLLLPITRCGSCALVQYPSCTPHTETGRLLLCRLPAGDSRCA